MAKSTGVDMITALGTDELRDYKTLIRQLSAEFIGTFLYLALVLFARTSVASGIVTIAFANGLLVASIVQLVGHISGGHINPAITVGAFVCGHMKILKAILYIIAQVLGSIVGCFVAYEISDDHSRGHLGVTVPFVNLSAIQVFFLELLMTFVLVAVALSVVDTKRRERGLGSAPLAIGLSITACQCSALFYSGSLNPVRSFGPAIVMNIWVHHWVFWAGPLLGGVLAGLAHKFVFTIPSND